MPSGGARIGAGRKPKPKPFVVYRRGDEPSTDVGEVTSAEPAVMGEVSVLPPEDLPADQKAVWQQYAQLAMDRRTLVPQTVPAFLEFCELMAEKRAVKRTIDHDGRTYLKVTVDGSGQEHQELKAHPLKADYAKLAKSVESYLLKFMLAPFGKPAGGSSARTPLEQKKADVRAKFFGTGS